MNGWTVFRHSRRKPNGKTDYGLTVFPNGAGGKPKEVSTVNRPTVN